MFQRPLPRGHSSLGRAVRRPARISSSHTFTRSHAHTSSSFCFPGKKKSQKSCKNSPNMRRPSKRASALAGGALALVLSVGVAALLYSTDGLPRLAVPCGLASLVPSLSARDHERPGLDVTDSDGLFLEKALSAVFKRVESCLSTGGVAVDIAETADNWRVVTREAASVFRPSDVSRFFSPTHLPHSLFILTGCLSWMFPGVKWRRWTCGLVSLEFCPSLGLRSTVPSTPSKQALSELSANHLRLCGGSRQGRFHTSFPSFHLIISSASTTCGRDGGRRSGPQRPADGDGAQSEAPVSARAHCRAVRLVPTPTTT